MVIDTNVFLEVFLGQSRATDCLSFLSQIERGEIQGYITDFTAHSLAVVLERGNQGDDPPPRIFDALFAFEGLTLLHASLSEQAAIAALASQIGLDFDDSYQA